MSKLDTLKIKGIAITFMLFYHLYLPISSNDFCSGFFCIGGLPLAQLITRAMNPVSFFIILSGYGLYISHHKGSFNMKNAENWLDNYEALKAHVLETDHFPNRAKIEGRGLLNWYKYNAQLIKQGKLSLERGQMIHEVVDGYVKKYEDISFN